MQFYGNGMPTYLVNILL